MCRRGAVLPPVDASRWLSLLPSPLLTGK